MVNAAIKNLKDRGGSSLQATKKYITVNHKVDAEKLAPFIRKYLKSAVASSTLTQPKGKGASGSFRLFDKGGTKAGGVAVKKVKSTSKPKSKKKPKSSVKKTVAKKPATAKKAAKPKTRSKAKKVSIPTTKKPKSPKPKKPKTPKKSAAKKK